MNILAINNTNFGNKKFRIPVKIIKSNNDSVITTQKYIPKEQKLPGNFVMEYDYPKAGDYFSKAMKSENLDEKLHYLDLMGDYKIVNIEMEEKINRFINMVDKL